MKHQRDERPVVFPWWGFPLAIIVALAYIALVTEPAKSHSIKCYASGPKADHRCDHRNLAHAEGAVRFVLKRHGARQLTGVPTIIKNHRWLAKQSKDRIFNYHGASLLSAWLPTYYCEKGRDGWTTNTGNGYYGGLQFDMQTWRAHGGLEFASRADLATPIEQVTVASRLTYDGWPNCPNP